MNGKRQAVAGVQNPLREQGKETDEVQDREKVRGASLAQQRGENHGKCKKRKSHRPAPRIAAVEGGQQSKQQSHCHGGVNEKKLGKRVGESSNARQPVVFLILQIKHIKIQEDQAVIGRP